jgi:hypothetical protein
MAEQSTVEVTPTRGGQLPASGTVAPGRRRFRHVLFTFLLLVTLGSVAFISWRLFFAKPRGPERVIALSGRIEEDDSAVAPKTSGRILEVRYREGDVVKAGDTIAVLDDAQILAREEQAKAVVRQSEAKAQSARDQIAVLQEQLRQGQLETEQAKIDAEGRVRQAAAMQAVALGGFLLVFLLSGLIFPVENIPVGLRWLSRFVWGRYYIEIVRDALLQGGGWPAVWYKVLIISVIGATFYTLAWRGLRRMQLKG